MSSFTSNPTILARATMGNFMEWANAFDNIWLTHAELKVVPPSFADRVSVTDLENALATGETCDTFKVVDTDLASVPQREIDGNVLIDLVQHFGSVSALYSVLSSLDWETAGSGYYDSQRHELNGTVYEIHRSEAKGVRTFSPLHLHRVKPLSSAPKKWTIRSAYRAVVNGQFQWLKSDGTYTDDYARDAANDFYRGEIENHLPWIANIIERPSGWRVWVDDEDEQIISVNCHSFDLNSFKFCLEPEGRLAEAR
jgi:hypothetical protein